MRVQHEPRFSALTCGTCDPKTRAAMHCPIPGPKGEPPEPPAPAPAFRVDMGPTKRAHLSAACPVGLALTDEVAIYLSAWALLSRWREWPPGRRDPRFLDAAAVIQREQDQARADAIKKPPGTPST